MNEETTTLLTTYIRVVIETWPDKGIVPCNVRELPWQAICCIIDGDTPACHEAARRANAMISLARDCASVRRPWKDCLKAMMASPDVSVETEPSRLRDAARVVLKAFPPPWASRYKREQVKALQDLNELVGD